MRFWQPILAAAFALAGAMAYATFFAQLAANDRLEIGVAIKGGLFVLAAVALIVTLNWTPGPEIDR